MARTRRGRTAEMTIGDWKLKVTGEVVRVERENIDKSGRNPKYFYTFVVRSTALDAVPEGAVVPDEVPIRVKDVELERLTDSPPKTGDQVVMTARASGPRPQTFYLTAIE